MTAITTTDRWTCPSCGDTTTGNSRARRQAQIDHAKDHNTARPSVCTSCQQPFSPAHDPDAPGPKVRHNFTTADPAPAAPRRSRRKPAPGALDVPQPPTTRSRKR